MQTLNIIDGHFSDFNAFNTTAISEVSDNKLGYALLDKLQITLDLQEILTIFSKEAANMLKFQQAYQAASQIISVASVLFDTLISVAR